MLVVPYRKGDHVLASGYELMLTRSRGVRIVDISLRAAKRVKVPDALELVAVLAGGCKVFVTNDRNLPAGPGISILDLASYLRS